MKFTHGWYDEIYDSILVSIDACNLATSKNGCKSKDEIEEFLDANIFYVVA